MADEYRIDGWHLDKRVSIGHIVTTVVVISTFAVWLMRLDGQLQLLRQDFLDIGGSGHGRRNASGRSSSGDLPGLHSTAPRWGSYDPGARAATGWESPVQPLRRFDSRRPAGETGPVDAPRALGATWAQAIGLLAAASALSLVEPTGLLKGNLAGVAALLFVVLADRRVRARGERWEA